MPDNYTLEGENYSHEDVLGAARGEGLTIGGYLQKFYPEDALNYPKQDSSDSDVVKPDNTVESDSTVESDTDSSETRETSWWLGEEGFIPDEWQGIKRPDVEVEKPSQEVTGQFYGFGGLVITEEKEKKRKEDKVWIEQSKNLKNEIEKVFADPKLFQNTILEDNETLQNIVVGSGGQPVRNPEEALKDYFHEKIKGFGWIGERNVDSETGLPLYNKLTNSDIDGIIDEIFDLQYEQETTNKRNEFIKVGEGGDDNSRKADINTYTGVNKQVANLVEQINHGGLSKDDKEDAFNQLLNLKINQGKTDVLFNYNNGQLIYPKSEEDLNRLLEEDGIEPLQKKHEDYQGLTLDELAFEYKQSSLAMGGLNKELDKKRYAIVKNLFSDVQPEVDTELGDFGTVKMKQPEFIPIEFTLRDWINNGKRYTNPWTGKVYAATDVKLQGGGDIDQLIERSKDDIVEYTATHETLKSMYLLNDGLLNIEKDGVETAVQSFIEPFVGRYGTREIMGGPTGRQKIDKAGEIYGELGIPLSKAQEKYIERDIAETVNEGLFGSGRILAEFYAVGKFLKPIEYATGLAKYTNYLRSSRFRNSAGTTYSEANVLARASSRGMKVGDKGVKGSYANMMGLTKVPPTIGMRAQSLGIAALTEGIKFEGITRFDTGGEESGFWTGFGFGAAGRMIAPLAPYLASRGYLKDIDKRIPLLPKNKIVGSKGLDINLSGQALFQQFVSAPASFVVGSEAGEIMHSIVDDAFGNKQYSDFMEEHYGDYGEVGKRMISNYFIGVGFGMAGPHGSMFRGFADFKSETGIRKTRDKAFDNAKEILRQGGFTNPEIAAAGEVIGYETRVINGKEVKVPIHRNQTAEWQNRFHKNLTESQKSEYNKHKEVYQGMNGKLFQLQRAKGYMDPLKARDMVEKDMKHVVESNRQLGIETEIEVVHNNNLQPGQKQMGVDAEIITKKGGKRKIYRFNAETYTPDIKAHEVSHDFFETQFEKDAIFKGEFMTHLHNIAGKIDLERLVTEQEAKELGAPERVGKRMNLSEAIKLEKFDLKSSINNQRISQWELFSHIAQQIGTKANYLKIKNSDGYMKLGNLIKDFGKKGNQKYNLSLESDVVRWFRDYSKNVKKGIDTRPMFAELESVIDYGATMQQRINMRAQGLKEKAERGYHSVNVEKQRKTFLDNQQRSIEAKREGGRETPLYAVDKFVFDNKGNRKYDTLEQFKANESDYWGAWETIFGPDGVFDAHIARGMREKNPDINLESFEASVKELLLTRFQRNFNPKEGGGSLYGYFENHAVPYEKLRVQERYFETRGFQENVKSIDSFGPEGEAMQVRAEVDSRMKSFENENILQSQIREAKAKKEGKEIETTPEEGRIFSEMMGRDKSGVQSKINKAVKEKNIDLDKTKPIYKTLKKWLTEVEKLQRGVDKKGKPKLVDPTKESDVKPLGVLAKVMEIVSKEYGIPLNRLLAKQTLTDPMRSSARDYIKNKVTQIREGVFPEGETPSGIATGAANTSWKGLYDFKGKRGEFKKGKTAAGKEVVKKRTNITDAEILERIGINPKTLEYAKGTSFDGAIKELIKFDATIEAKQALTTLGRGIFSDSVIGEMGAGRPEGMASRNLEKQGFNDQVNFLFEIQGKTFEKMFKRNLTNIDDPAKAISKTLVDYFTDYKARGNEFNISNADLRTIGTELHKEFKFTSSTPKKWIAQMASKAAKAIELPNTIAGVNRRAGIKNQFTLNTESDVLEARVATRVVVKALTEKYGDGIYEAMLMRGESGGKGVGPYASWVDLKAEVGKGQNRFSLHESAADALMYMSDIVNSKGKKYSGPLKALVEGQGNKAGQMNRLIDRKTGEWNEKALNEAFETGEFTKKVLLDAVEALREAYTRQKDPISDTQVRQWIEIHAGPMSGLIKLAGSFAVVPNMSPKKMFSLYPKTTPKINAKGNVVRYKKNVLHTSGKNKGKVKHRKGDVVYESNYVLEHTTPAQEIKARIYDYIINGGEAKKSAMDLTLRDYHTTLIPKQFDAMVNKTLQTTLPSWHLPGMDPVQSRYYEANHPSDFGFGLRAFAGHRKGKVYDHSPELTDVQKQRFGNQLNKVNKKLFPKGLRKAAEGKLNSKNLEDLNNIGKALNLGRKKNKKSRGMSTFDFDETVGVSENFVIARKGKETKRISSAEWPEVGDTLLKEGWKMDFTDFNKVTKGKPGPLMEKLKNQIKKFGSDNVYILTARAPESAKAIRDWLKSEGVDIPLKNITGLGNSTGEAKALWMLEKFAEGYNDMYFVDDAISNVKAVKEVLSQLDIKSKVQQALAAKNLDADINNMMESNFGIDANKRFSKAEAKVRGKNIKGRKFFISHSAADLELLLEPMYGKGKKGIQDKKWFKKEFIMPFERGIRDYNLARQTAKNDYLNLRKNSKDVVKILSNEIKGTSFTNDMAVRVYLWNKAGYKIPDLAKTTEAKLIKYVRNNPKLQAYAETFGKISKIEKGIKEPSAEWWNETLAGEVTNPNRGISRKAVLQEWIDIKNEIFSEQNMNKIESKLGTKWRENIEDMFNRMETGRTTSEKIDKGSQMLVNYLNGSVGTIMNFNTRSAMLQTISTLNFLNMRENNPIAAAKAMGNIKQFTKDFMFIMNSDMLKQRRNGLEINVSEAELAEAAASSKNSINAMLAKVLKVGYTPTKLADSFAISLGGATYYRNRIKMYEREGMSLKDAEKKAWLDFQVLAERTQQSSRADLLSKQQTELQGRFLLHFANTPMQMNRAGMKELLDLSKGRYENLLEAGEKIGKVSYYMGAQVALFAGLQTALFSMLLNDDDVPEEHIVRAKSYALNTAIDSFLSGFGVQGRVLSGVKNATLEYFKQHGKGHRADYSEVAEDLLNISPAVGSKFSKLDKAGDEIKYADKDEGFKLEIGNPYLKAALLTIEATVNAPLHGWHQNAENVKHSLNNEYETWQRAHMAGGWSPWSVGVDTKDSDFQLFDWNSKRKKKNKRKWKDVY